MIRNFYLLLSFIFLTAAHLYGQPTCEDPTVEIEDDIENYASGDVTMQSALWALWPGATTGGIATDEQAGSGLNSIKISSEFDDQDALFLLGDKTSGHYIVRWQLFVPDSSQANFSVQHQMPTMDEDHTAFDVYMENGDGILVTYDGGDDIAFDYDTSAWFNVFLLADLDNDQARLIIGQETVHSWQFSTGSTMSNQLNSINFYPADDRVLYYVDDITLLEIPAPEAGQYCYTAEVIDAPGFYTVPTLECFGAGYDLTGGEDAFAGYWFAYTPTEDGIISIASCDGGVDTRGWIFSGDCRGLTLVGVNDDQCDLGDGDEWASFREAVVSAGTTYYIMWDDVWEADGFGWDLGFRTTPPEPGNFCQSAFRIQPGEHEVIEIDGDAAVAGPNINNTTSSTTSYTQSEWFAYTATADGMITITTCEGAFEDTDTDVYVYTGDCSSIDGLTLVGTNDNGCGDGDLRTLLEMPVTAGTTYYIEWIDRWGAVLYLWDLIFMPAAANTVTFSVDMSLETVDPAGVFIAGSFTGFENIAMADDDSDGIYTIDLPLNQNETHTYKFKNGPDGWESINTSIGEDCTTGGFADRFVDVGTSDVVLDPVCFGYCVACNTVDVTEAELAAAVQVFPNPATDLIQVQYEFEEAVSVLNIRLIDALGRSLRSSQLEDVQAGTFELGLQGIPAGVYQLQLRSEGAQLSRTIVVQ